MSLPAARLAALEEWIGLGRAFLRAHRPGTPLDQEAMAGLLRRREELLAVIGADEAPAVGEAEAALRLRVVEEELLRRVELDLARRRRELDELDQTRRLLRGYGEDREGPSPPARFIDTRS